MDTLCAWIRNDLQSAEPQKGTVRAAAGANRLHHSSHEDSCWLCGGTEGAPREHHDTSTCPAPPAPPSDPSCPFPSAQRSPATQEAAGMLQALLLTRVLPLVPPFPLEVVVVLLVSPHLRMYLIFVRAGHSPWLNPAQARSVPANGS